MLVLERKEHERIILTVGSERIVVSVEWIGTRRDSKRVKLGWTASENVTIHREEIQNQIDNPNPPQGAS